MRSINFYLVLPYKKGVLKADIKALKKQGKPVTRLLSEKPVIILLVMTFPGRKLVRVNTMEKVKPIYWDFNTKSVKPTMHGSLELNDRLQYFKAEATRRYREALTKDPKLSLDQIREILENVVSLNTPDFSRKAFLDYFEQFVTERVTLMNPLTTKKYNSLLKVLNKWMEHVQLDRSNFFLEDIDGDFEHSFKEYLIKERDLVNHTISKYFECIKTFMRWASEKGYHDSRIFENFKIKRPAKDVVWLNAEEIKLIQEYKPESDYMRRIQLSFLFMIYCGQRFSDVRNLKRRDLVVTESGEVDWHLYQLKGSRTKKIIIPLMPSAVAILERLRFKEMLSEDNVIPIGCNQWMNRAIKDMCKDVGIDTPTTVVRIVGTKRTERSVPKYKLISCHTSRRSFVSLSIQHGMNTEYLGTITGHSSVKTMRLYLGVNQQTKRAELNKAWDKIL
jgi:integrase